jgi:hypothetical protein
MSNFVRRRLAVLVAVLGVSLGAPMAVVATDRSPAQSNYLGPPKQASVAHPSRPQETNIPAALRSEPLPARPHKSNRLP